MGWAAPCQSQKRYFEVPSSLKEAISIPKTLSLREKTLSSLDIGVKSRPKSGKSAELLARTDKFWRHQNPVDARIKEQKNKEGFEQLIRSLDQEAYKSLPQEGGGLEEYYLESAQELIESQASPAEKLEMLHRLDPLAKSYRESSKSTKPQAKPNRPWILQELAAETTKNPENRKAVKEWLRSLKK